MDLGSEINDNIKSSIKTKLQELGSYIDDELPEYIMVMIANKRSQYQMTEDLSLFLGDETEKFVLWVFEMMAKLHNVMKNSKEELAKGESDLKTPVPVKDETIEKSSSRRDASRSDRESSRSKHSRKRRHGGRPSTEEMDNDDHSKNQTLRSKVEALTRKSLLPISKQATGSLLRRAMEEAKQSVSDSYATEYNPADVNPESWSKDKEVTRKQKVIYLERHRKLQQMKQRENEMEPNKDMQHNNEVSNLDTSKDPGAEDEGIELEVSNNEFIDEKRNESIDSPHRVVARPGDKNNDNDSGESTDDERNRINASRKSRTVPNERERKRTKPRFVVTLDGVDSQITEKYEKEEEQREKRRRRFGNEDSDENIVVDMTRPSVHSRLEFRNADHTAAAAAANQLFAVPINERFNNRMDMTFVGNPQFGVFPPQAIVVPQYPIDSQHMLAGYNVNPFSAGQVAVSTPTVRLPNNNRLSNRQSNAPRVDKVHITLGSDDENAEPMDISTEGENTNFGMEKATDEQPLERCRFWPDCKNGEECPFVHPTIPCKMFPNCKYGEHCIFLHPKCKFDTKCTNPKCFFTHSTKKRIPSTPAPLAAPIAASSPVCKFFPNCTKLNCPFLHPSSKTCRYGALCTNKFCTYSHPTQKHASRSMKWIAPNQSGSHISERPFATKGAIEAIETGISINPGDGDDDNGLNEPAQLTLPTAPVIQVEN